MISIYSTIIYLIFSSFHFSHCHETVNPLTGDQGVPSHEHHLPRDHPVQDQHGADPKEPITLNFDEKVMHDKAHIHGHLDGIVKPDENASDEELEFYYFKLHDYDKDDHLDGLELFKAFLHEHKEEPIHPEADVKQVIATVDEILHKHDKDVDGKLSYMEYHHIATL